MHLINISSNFHFISFMHFLPSYSRNRSHLNMVSINSCTFLFTPTPPT